MCWCGQRILLYKTLCLLFCFFNMPALRCCCPSFPAPEQVSAPTDGVFGCGAHSDYGMLTILATDGVPGLQVRRCVNDVCLTCVIYRGVGVFMQLRLSAGV